MRARNLVAMLVFACGCSEERAASPAPTDAGATIDEPAPLVLPDPLAFPDGRRVATKEEWPERRAQILELFTKHVYGRPPGTAERVQHDVIEENPAAMGGAATLRRVRITSHFSGRQHAFELILFAPPGKRSGTFLMINIRKASNTDPTRATKSEFWPAEQGIARGYAMAVIQASELAPDDEKTYADGVIRLFEGDAPGARPRDAGKALAAWSWGASRALDYLVTDPLVEPSRVAVIGHSRGGKAALWAGAQDPRFSLTISNDSGCGGAAISRRPVGETVELVNAIFPHWFADAFRAYNGKEAELPIDQHMLIALLAPRAAVVASASEDTWADPEGEYLGLAHASPVYALWGFAPIAPNAMPQAGQSVFVAPRGYHLRPGEHDLVLFDWERYWDVADRIWAR